MKNKRTIVIVIALVLLIAVIAGIIIVKNKKQDQKLLKIYEELKASQAYYFQMEQNDENKTIMAKKDNKTVIDQYSADTHSTTIVKENNTYLVLHDREEYYIYKQNNVEQSILTDGLKEVMEKEYTTGTEKVKGKKYYYEEYNGSSIFMVSNILNADELDIKTKFYFDKDDNLVYIKTVYTDKEELIKTSIQKEVNDEIFEIPSNYAEN